MSAKGARMRSFLLTFCLFWAAVTPLPAQQYNIKTWSIEEGLPQASIMAMTQDSNGYLWLATLGGLSKFDGKTFQNFTNQDGLCSNKIKALLIDRTGKLWIATNDKGICRFNGVSFENFSSASGMPLEKITGNISGIAQAADGTIWISTARGVAYLKNGRFHLLNNMPGLPAQPYSNILIDRKGAIWLSTFGNGIYRFNGKTAQNFRLEHGLGNKIVYSLFEAKNGTIWIGHYGGITKYNGRKFTKIDLPGDINLNRAMGFAELSGNRLFIATDGGGLYRFMAGKFNRFGTENGLPTNFLSSLLSDTEGNLWMGTTGGGFVRYTPNGFSFFGLLEGLKNENVTTIQKTGKNSIWLGTFGGGIARFDGKKFTWINQKDGLPSDNISDIKADPAGNLWISTNQGLSYYNGSTFKNYTQDNGLIFNVVNFSLPEANNQTLVATNAGLSIFDGTRFQNYTVPKNREANIINCLFRDRQNRLWLGTRNGIYEFKNGKFVTLPELENLNLKDIRAITQDKYNNLWFTAFNYGLLRYSPAAATNRVQLLTNKAGFLTECVTGLRIDSYNQLWVGTIKGLHRLDLEKYQKQQKVEISTYGIAEGLRGIEINANAMTQDPEGFLWFGTVKGLARFNPFLKPKENCIPKLNLLNIRLFLQHTNWDSMGFKSDPITHLPQRLRLKDHQNYLSFDYNAICLTNPEMVRYSHFLEGFDTKWTPFSTENTTTYPNLSPGNYVFKVKACTIEGPCNPKITEYAFAIVPPFWTKDRIIGVLVLMAAGLAFGLARWREMNLKRLNLLLEQNVEQRTRLLEKENAEKEILLKEVHHRVKNNLQIITSLLNLQSRHVSDPAVLDSLREIKDRIKSISMLHQRLYQRDELAAIDLSEYVQTLCRSLFASYGVMEERVRLEFDIPPLNLDIDTALTLGLIVNELVSNTLKYAFPEQRSGTLLIELLRVTETEYTLTISDDGTGLPDNFEEKMATSFGLQLVSSLIKKLQGKLKFYSEGGTQIRLQFVILPQ